MANICYQSVRASRIGRLIEELCWLVGADMVAQLRDDEWTWHGPLSRAERLLTKLTDEEFDAFRKAQFDENDWDHEALNYWHLERNLIYVDCLITDIAEGNYWPKEIFVGGE